MESVVDCSRQRMTSDRHTPSPHLFWPRSGFPRFPGLVLVSTDSEWAGLPSWKVAWSYVLNFLSYSRSKLINFSGDFSGIFQRSSNLNTYRNEASKDIFSCSSQSLWIWVIWRLFGGFNHQPAQFRWTGEGSTTALLQRKRYSNIFSRISLIKTSSESPFSGLQVLVQAFFD